MTDALQSKATSQLSRFVSTVRKQTMRTADFDYELPPELIARSLRKAESRACLFYQERSKIEHRSFPGHPGIPENQGMFLVFQKYKGHSARLFGRTDGARIEVVYSGGP